MAALDKAIRRTLLKVGGVAGLSDDDLLARFVAVQEPTAFEELVRRHGPLVMRVCQRVLHHAQDAEDAFQATFIVLARKAATIGQRALLANWLYGVAYRTALNAKKRRAICPTTGATAMEKGQPATDAGGSASTAMEREMSAALADEVHRLPEKYRAAVVLCCLEGKTNAEAAVAQGCPTGTIETRLARARVMLRDRLVRRGVTLSGGGLTTLLAPEAASAAVVPLALAATTSQAAVMAATGHGLAARDIAAITDALAASTLKEMSWCKSKLAAAVAALALIGAPVAVVLSLLSMKPVTATSGSLTASVTLTATASNTPVTASTPVTLTSAFNRVGIVTDGSTFSGGLDPYSAACLSLQTVP